MIKMYAIPNCDTVKKARSFLEKNNIDYEFIDFKKSAPTVKQINAWTDFLGELPVNKKGMTYRKYKEQYETSSQSEKINLMIANSSIIKRPILMQNDKTIALGFDETQYQDLLKHF